MVTPTGPGAVVLVTFPFSDLSQAKLRPTVVLAEVGRGDWVLCQITSNSYGDARAIRVTGGELQSGSLRLTSFVRPGKLFTASANLIVREVAKLKTDTFDTVIDQAIDILRPGESARTR